MVWAVHRSAETVTERQGCNLGSTQSDSRRRTDHQRTRDSHGIRSSAQTVSEDDLHPVAVAPLSTERLIALFLQRRRPRTVATYREALLAYARYKHCELERAVYSLIEGGAQVAVVDALDFVESMRASGLAAATINQRLSTLRTLSAFAKDLGLIDWQLSLPGEPRRPYRDTRGPGLEGVQRLLEIATHPRDQALVRLAFELGLRRAEVVSLDLEHVDLEAGRILVLGKGDDERTRLDLPTGSMAALESWVRTRGTAPGPLFTSLSRATRGNRLSTRGLGDVYSRLRERAGVRGTFHGLRHAAITAALEVTNGNIREVQCFSRHRDPRTVILYDDDRQGRGAQVAEQLSTILNSGGDDD